MKVNAVIAEYNPFHNGHKYQLADAKKATHADYTIVLMSGNFVQRGMPAIVNKQLRAEAALRNGADLVLELPALCSTASAEYFAAGAVHLLNELNVVDYLCFGCEIQQQELLTKLVDIIISEPPAYKETLKAALSEGMSFPKARQEALLACLPPSANLQGAKSVPQEQAAGSQDIPQGQAAGLQGIPQEPAAGSQDIPQGQAAGSQDIPQEPAAGSQGIPQGPAAGSQEASASIASLLASPNSILALEYLKALKKKNSTIKPYITLRSGSGYHEEALADSFASATGLRKVCFEKSALLKVKEASGTDSIGQADSTNTDKCAKELLQDLMPYVPADTMQALCSALAHQSFTEENDFSAMLFYQLLYLHETGYTDYLDVSADLSNRIRKNLPGYRDYVSFCELLKTKEVTYSRISRCLMHILLQIRQYPCNVPDALPGYVRVLGFRRDATPLLSELGKCSALTLLTKPADAQRVLEEQDYHFFCQQMFCDNLYEQVRSAKAGEAPISELSRPIIIV